MHLNARPPVLVPSTHWQEIEKLSKAALMDMVWSFAGRCSESADDAEAVMREFRAERDVVLNCRYLNR